MLIKNLKYWLQPIEKLFIDFENFTLDINKPDKRRIFIDRDSDVLFVAHIDTVLKPKYIRQQKTKAGKIKRIYAHGLDDRIGCMIAYELSEQLNADLLICDNEEKCKSTGQYHGLKEYNWIAEFDRAGRDVVTYELDCDEFRQAISEYWKIGTGAFSDISQLKTTACCMNIGIGYEFAHSKDSHVCVKTMERQIIKFKQFYTKYKDVMFTRDKKIDFSQCDRFEYSAGECELCGMLSVVNYVFGHVVCKPCFEDMFNEYAYFIK